MVLFDTQLVDIIIVLQNGKSEPSRLLRALLCHDLHVVHLPKLLYDNHDVVLCRVWGKSAEKHLLCPLVGLRVLILPRDSTLAFNLRQISDKGGEKKIW